MPLIASNFKTTTPLDNFSISYANDLDGFAGLKIFTPFPVAKNTFSYYVMGKEGLRLDKLEAPSGTQARSSEWSAFTATATAVEHAHKALVLQKDARDFDRAVADLRQDAAAHNMSKLMIEIEAAAHTKVTTSGNYPSALTSTLAAGVTWAVAAGDPLEDVRLAKAAVFAAVGKVPNAMALSYTAMEYLRNNPQIRDSVKYTQAGPPNDAQIAAFLGLEEIIVSKAVYNSATEGAADTLGSIWLDDALIFVKKDETALRSMTYGRCFMPAAFYTKTIDAPELGRGLGAEWLESGWEWCLNFCSRVSSSDTDANAGYLLKNVY